MKTTITLTNVGEWRKFEIYIRLNDECKNGHEDFSITGAGWEKGVKYRSGDCGVAGCCHDEILKLRPDLKPFVDLHLSDFNGTPTYAIANGFYHMNNSGKEVTMNYLRISEDEYKKLLPFDDKAGFALMLEDMGVPDRWKEEANKAIKMLESMTGKKFVSKATRTQWDGPNDKDRELARLRFSSGYYTSDKEKKRAEDKEAAAKQAKKDKAMARYEAACKKEKIEMNITVIMADKFPASYDNYIYYNSRNAIVFNWNDSSYNSKITKDEFDAFVSSLTEDDLMMLPVDVKFELK